MNYLSTHNLCIGYKTKTDTTPILSGLNLTLEQGSLVALLGANGAGKSTLLRTITAIQPPLSGEIDICGRDISSLSQKDRSKIISIVTTDRIMAGALTVFELVALGRHPHTGFLGRLSEKDKQIVDQSLKDAGIYHKSACYVSQLSDGERQKAMIAKSLAQDTPIIILDEPTAFLDVASRFEAMKLLHDLAHKHKKAVLLSSHDIAQSLLLADKVWMITEKREMITGNTEDLILDAKLNDMFNSSALRFNPEITDFEAVLPHHATVCLKCHDAALHRCLTNALLRNGFAIGCNSPTIITAVDARHLDINGSETNSIQSLIDILKSM